MPELRKFSPQRGFKIEGIIETLCNTCTNIHQLEFAGNQRVPLHILIQILAAFPNLAHLKIPVSKVVDHLKFFKCLITLNFTEYYLDIDQNVLSIIADDSSMLQHLNMGSCTFPDQDIKYFLEKKKYQLLSLSMMCYISTLMYVSLTECTNLEYLEYENFNYDLPNMYVHLFSKLSNLRNLSISNYGEENT